MIFLGLTYIDRDYSCRFVRTVRCVLGFGLILDDEEESTEDYDSTSVDRNTLDEM